MSKSHHGLYGSDISLLSPTAAALARKNTLKWVIAVTAALGAILEIIDTSIVNVAMPEIQGNLGATLSEAGWVSTGYACANVVMIPLAAWLSDRFGRKRYLLFSLIGFTASSAMCGLAPNLGFLILSRIIQGLCGGGLLAKAQSILYETFPREEQPAAQAMFGISVIAGPALGPVLGGYLTDSFGWRWIFFVNLPVGILAVLMATIFLPRDADDDISHQGVDWAGIAFLALGLGCFQTMLEQGQEDDWFSSRFISTMAVGAALGVTLFIWRELTTPHPAVDLRVLKHRSLAAGSLYSMLLGMGLYGIMFAIPIFLQVYLGFTALQSGLTLLPGAIGSAIMMVILGRVAGRIDARFLICCGAGGMAVTALLLAHINPDTGTDSLFFPLLLRGLTTTLMFLPLTLATLGSLPKKSVAHGAGFYNLTRQMGSSIGIALITTLLSHREFVHRTVLVEKVTSYAPATIQRLKVLTGVFTQEGADPYTAHQRALAALDRMVNGQAMLLSFADVFRYTALAFLVTLPLLFLLSRGGNKEAAAAAH